MKKYPLGRKIPNNCHFILNGRVLSPLDFNWEVTDSGNHAFVEKKLLLEPGSVLHIDCHKKGSFLYKMNRNGALEDITHNTSSYVEPTLKERSLFKA
jgi:hypothetical protein